MNRRWMFRGLKFFAFAVLAALALGYAVMALWNFVIPGLTGWHALGFPQALALLVLSRLLLGGWRGPGGAFGGSHGLRAERWRERWAQLSPEERARLRERFNRCGSWREPPPAEPTASTAP